MIGAVSRYRLVKVLLGNVSSVEMFNDHARAGYL